MTYVYAYQTIPDECPDHDAAIELVGLMRELSEEHWASGWLVGLEHELWEVVFEDPERDFGFGNVSFADRAKLIELSYRCGGWWCWDENLVHERFITFEEWLPRYQDDVR